MESNHLFHEMWHAYQAYQETVDSYKNAELNLEIEAHYAQYLYLKKLPEYPGSKWHLPYFSTKEKYRRFKYIAELEWCINTKGEIHETSSIEMLNSQIEDIVEIFHKTKSYENCIFDESRSSLSMFGNLNLLTKDC